MEDENNKYCNDELEAPEWLQNKEFFKDILMKYENDLNIEILDIKTTPASIKGDHYASIIFRFTVKYRPGESGDKIKSMIVKTLPDYEGHKQTFLQDTHIFETEIGMYTQIVPKMEDALRSIGDETTLSPKCLHYGLSPRKFIVFEDIVPLGYAVMRERPLNMEEVKAAYTKLAKWHAVAYKINSENPREFNQFRYGLFSLDNYFNDPVVTNACDLFNEMLIASDLAEYKPYFEALKPKLVPQCIASYNEFREQAQANVLYTLCHGDITSRNMMFKHNVENRKFEDVLLFDFQLSYVGPMANDIIYSIYQLLPPDMRLNHVDELVHHHFTTFQETLRKLHFNGEIPKLIDFKKQLIDRRHLMLFLLVTFLPMLYEAFQGEANADDMMTKEDYRRNMYMRKEYVEEVRKILPKLLHAGYLES